MRIIGGKHRGRKLAEFQGAEIRPTADRVKESLFNILSVRIIGARVLDLFCGSGNLGLESISRGAESVHFNDISKECLKVLEKNVGAVGERQACRVTNADYLTCLNATKDVYDIIFIDPPYRFDYGVPALQTIADRKLLRDGGVVVYERDRPFDGEVIGLRLYDERKYGKTYLSFFESEF